MRRLRLCFLGAALLGTLGCNPNSPTDASGEAAAEAPLEAGNDDASTDATTDATLDVVSRRDTGAVCTRTDAAMDGWLRDPPPLPSYSGGSCPMLRGGPTAAGALNAGFRTGSQSRAFYLLVPRDYSPTRRYPVLFSWHWLAGSAQQMIREGQLEEAVNQLGIIAVVPEALSNDAGLVFGFDWPFIEADGQAAELQFFDDMLACVTRQYSVDPRRIHAAGVSAGGLWLTYLSTTPRVNWLASIASLSGGLGQMDPFVSLQWAAQDNKYAALVLWGGPNDHFVLDFQAASQRYRDNLRCDHHFVVQCVHDAGHAVPPLPVPDGGTRFGAIWQFLLDHPYGMGPDQSPYLDGGLPSSMPPWCNIVP